MRTHRPVAALLALALMATPAFAQKVDGAYEVKFEEMSTNCDPPRFAYARGTVKIDSTRRSLRVNIQIAPAGAMIPQMAGVPAKSGKVSAKTLKKSATTVQGLDGTYRVSGRVDDSGVLQLVLVAEFTKSGETRTLCTQSWNISGVRTASAGKRSPKKPRKSSAEVLFLPAFE